LGEPSGFRFSFGEEIAMGAARLSVFEQAVREAVAEADEEGRGDRGAGLGEESAKNAGGRPKILNETKRAEVCALLATGCSLRAAARYVGCDVSTLSKLKERDAAFRDQVVKALAERESFPLAKMREAAGRSWRAAAWLLERTVGGTYRRDSSAEPVDWEREITAEAMERLPEVATRVVERFGGAESDEARYARWMKELEPRDEAADVIRRGGLE
jgi:hypothetical protein